VYESSLETLRIEVRDSVFEAGLSCKLMHTILGFSISSNKMANVLELQRGGRTRIIPDNRDLHAIAVVGYGPGILR